MEVLRNGEAEARAKGGLWCPSCPLRSGHGQQDFSAAELELMRGFKQRHAWAWAGEVLVEQSGETPALFTLFSGWAARYRTIASGERQLVGVALPGDLVGFDAVLCGAAATSVVALTDVTMCMFDAERLGELLGDTGLSHRAARSQALALRRAADRLTAIGARDARSNLLHFLLDLHDRLKPRNMTQADGFKMPLTQQHLAEAVGATVVHVHRTLRMLRHEGLLTLDRGRVVFHDMARLREIAGVPERTHEPEPLL